MYGAGAKAIAPLCSDVLPLYHRANTTGIQHGRYGKGRIFMRRNVIAALALMVWGAGLTAAVAQQPVKLGVLNDQTGLYADLTGMGSVHAARMAVEDYGGKVLGRPMEHIQIALDVIRHLDPYPGLRYSDQGARQIEPDVYIFKEGDDYIIQLNDDDLPQLRLNAQYRKMLDRDHEPNKEIRNYVKDRYAAAIQLIKNIEQRKQTILKVCQSIVRRQLEFLEHGIDQLKPMMIKEVAEEIGVHPSTVSRAVASKYADTPQGVFELRYFFSEAVQGIAGSGTPLLILKRRVKKMIEEEDAQHPLTDEQITARLKSEGIDVTRRTVAKYREDMKIPSTHQRRTRN